MSLGGDHPPAGRLLGTALFGVWQQPFTLLLHSYESRILVRCVSSVGRVLPDTAQQHIKAYTARHRGRIGAIRTCEDATYDLTVEDDILLGIDVTHDPARVAVLVRRVAELADQLEQQLLPGRDEAFAAFRETLSVEEFRGR